jgi:putative NADH-flavin reductase
MQVTILGANGRVGQEVVRICLERGHQVVALAHSHDPFTPQLGLIVLKGDIYKAGDIATAVQGSQAVISTLGSWGTKDKNVLESAMQQLIPVMQEQAIKRLLWRYAQVVQQS